MAKAKTKDNMDPIADTPVNVDKALVQVEAPAIEDTPEVKALRARLEAEIRAKIEAEKAIKVDPGFIKPGVRNALQEAIANTVVQSGTRPLIDQPAVPLSESKLADGTIRQDY